MRLPHAQLVEVYDAKDKFNNVSMFCNTLMVTCYLRESKEALSNAPPHIYCLGT
jgi:hypothetical protein